MKKIISGIITFIFMLTVIVPAAAWTKDQEHVVETGMSDDQLTTTSESNTDVVSISAGSGMSAAVRADGSLWTWGCKDLTQSGATWGNHWSVDAQYKGQGIAIGANIVGSPVMAFSKHTQNVVCSLNKTETSVSPASNTPMLPGVTAVLKDDNSLWVWGGGCYGVLGDGESSSRYASWTPTKVLDNVISYDVSGYHFGAVTSDGSLYMWGYNSHGQIGNNTTENALVPTKIMDGVSSVAVGSYFSAAVLKDGSLWTWGQNNYGQLGDQTTDDSFVPKRITDNVKKVSLGESFAAILKTDGSVWTWGNNNVGQLGNGTMGTSITKPTKVIDLEDNNVIDIDTGTNNCAAITDRNLLYMWGGNSKGKLGNGSSTNQADPVITLNKVKMVSVGNDHTLAVRTDGTIWSWGGNSNGQLGNHTTAAENRPREIKLGELKVNFNVEGAGVKQLSVGWDDSVFQGDATKYNEDLAVDGIVLSEGAYSSVSVLNQYGFKILSNGQSNDSIDKPGYLIGYKVMYNFDEPQVEVIMAIRGTKSLLSVDALTDIKSVNDGFDGPTNYCYDRLKEARTKIATELGNLGLSNSKKYTKYFITGHSLGGACAGKLALKMANDGVAYTSNLYVYTYAAPNYTNIEKQVDAVEDLPNIYNIVNTADIVPETPKLMAYYWVIPISLHKAGHTIDLSLDNVDSSYTHIYNVYGETPWDINTPVKAHKTATYLAMINGFNEKAQSFNPKKILYRFLLVHCPVDVEVYDTTGELCAVTSGETVSYPKASPVKILIIDDQKYIELPDDSYRVKYIGTDTGTMKVEDQIVDPITGSVEKEKVFNNVILEEGKLFASNIEGDDDTSHTDLTVIDDEGDSTYLVDDNGNETKIAKYEINPDDVHINAMNQKNDGTEKTVEVTVENLTEGKDYRVIYKNNTDVGTASVSVKGINLYEGRVTETFEIFDSGSCGDEVQWTLSSDGLLSIAGRGDMTNYTDNSEEAPPWKMHSASIKEVKITEGITSIGDNAFKGCSELSVVDIPSSVVSIGNSAFEGCDKVQQVYFEGDNASWNLITIADNNNILNTVSIDYLGEKYLLGDTDRDGLISIIDATYIQRHLASIPIPFEFNERISDADEDGVISIMDATYIQRWLAQISSNDNIGVKMV